MSTTRSDPRIEALRRHLGEARFHRFVADLPACTGSLRYWQARELDLLEQAEGIVFSRDPATLMALLSPLAPAHPVLTEDDSPEWIVFEELGGSAPVQATGHTIRPACRFYFRARHEHWSIGVSTDPEVDPADVFGPGEHSFFHEEQFGFLRDEASYMPPDVARFFIVRELVRWRGSRESSAD